MNSHPVNKNYVQAGLEAHQDMQDWLNDPHPAPGPHPEVFDEEASRARHLLHHDGEMGHSSFRAGDTLIGPVEDEALTRRMERILEKTPEE